MPDLWQETPLIYSDALSNILDASVYLKLENLQPSYSFKFRGISHFIQKARVTHGPLLHVIIASGGNAGVAAACAAHALNVKCTVYLPMGAAEATVMLLQRQKASVVVSGTFYAEALLAAKKAAEGDQHAVLVPAYDDPIIWDGHASMVTEISQQLPVKPDAIFCSVGGGGLIGGLIVGCERVGWDDVPLVALETIGSDCFYHSMSLNQGRFNSVSKTLPQGVDLVFNDKYNVYLAHFNSFSSKASGSLGAPEPAARVVKMALERKGGTKCISVPDNLSMEACLKFADGHKMLVELACSTTLVAAYNLPLFNKLLPRSEQQGERPVVVFVICGGFKISMADLGAFRDYLEDSQVGDRTVKYDNGSMLVINS